MAVYEVENDDGSVYEIETDEPDLPETQPSPELPSTTGSLYGDTLDTVGGAATGVLSGLGDAFLGLGDFGGRVLASGVKSAQNMSPTWVSGSPMTDLFHQAMAEETAGMGDQSAVGREFKRAGNLAGTTLGVLSGAGAVKAAPYLGAAGRFLSSNPMAQVQAATTGGLLGQLGAEQGLYERGGTGQTVAELGAMVGPDLLGGIASLGKAGLRKLYQGADDASGEVINTIKGALDDPTVLTRPSGTSSAQALREERLGELAKLARTEAGQGVGAARSTIEELSPEVADNLAYLSALKKQKKFPQAGTNLQQISDEINRVTSVLDDVPATLTKESPFPLVNEKYGDVIPNIGATTSANPVKGAVDELLASKAEFSDLAKELQTVFKTSRNIGEEAYIEAASKVGARLKQPQAAKAFVELADGSPEMLSIGKSSLLQNIFSGTPTSWAKNINKTRGALQEMFTPSQIDALEAVATKNRGVVGGAIVANAARFFDNRVMRVGLLGVGGAFGGPKGFLAGAALNKIAKSVAEKPELMQQAISKAFQSGEAAQLLSQKASPQNVKKALEFFTNAGRNVIMGTTNETINKPNELADKLLPSDNGKKKDEVMPEIVQTKTAPTSEDSPLVKAVIKQESQGNINAISPKGAQGLMQLMPATGKEWHKRLGLEGKYDPYDPEQNKIIGTAYLNHMLDQFNGDTKLALAAYNWGIGNMKNLLARTGATSFDEIKDRLPGETQTYVKKITKNFDVA